MSSNLPYKQAANVERRTWDKETYEAKAKARIEQQQAGANSNDTQTAGTKRPLHSNKSDATTALQDDEDDSHKEEFQAALPGAAGPLHSKRAYLKARRGKIDLDSKVGKSEIINPDAVATIKSSTVDDKISTTTDGDDDGTCVSITDGVTKSTDGVGWHCKVCDCFLKDSLAYLDHINGKKHQRYLGFSMRIEKSTTNQVSKKLEALAKLKKTKKKKRNTNNATGMDNNRDDPTSRDNDGDDGDDLNEFEKAVKQKDEEVKRRKAERAKRREERKKKAQKEKKEQEKRKYVGAPADDGKEEEGVQEEEEVEEEEDNGGLPPDMAAMMGFSNFG